MIGKRYKEEKKAVGENQYTSKTTEDIKRVDHSEPPKTTAQKIAAIKQSLPNLDKNGGNSYHESRRNLDKTETKIAEQSKVSPKTQSEEDESGVVTVTTPKKTELKIAEQSKVSPKTVRNFGNQFSDVREMAGGRPFLTS